MVVSHAAPHLSQDFLSILDYFVFRYFNLNILISVGVFFWFFFNFVCKCDAFGVFLQHDVTERFDFKTLQLLCKTLNMSELN